MQAIGQTKYGEPEVLHFLDAPPPEPRPHDLLVRVKAAGINPVDAKVRHRQAAGTPVPDPPLIIGWDAAGIVEATGSKVTSFDVGDDVYFAGDITRPGAYAEWVAVDERIVARKPKTLSFEEAAALPLTGLTAWEALFENMHLPDHGAGASSTVLVMGGAGGVGAIAIQLAKKVAGLHVVATASRTASADFCLEMGADAVINHAGQLAPQLNAAGHDGVDYVLNCAPLTNMPQLTPLLNPLGTICCIVGGPPAQSLDVSALFPKRGTLTFEYMFARPVLDAGPERQGQVLDRIATLMDQGTLSSTLRRVMDWHDVHEAHRLIETQHTVGKIVMHIT